MESLEYNNDSESQRAIYSKYSAESLKIVKIALLAHASRVPVKKRDLTEAITPQTGSFSRTQIKRFFEEADNFLEEKFALSLIELPVVNLGPEHQSPNRSEMILISKVSKIRSILQTNVSETAKINWGILCLVLMMIVLHGDGVDFDSILNSVINAGLFEAELESENEENEYSSHDTGNFASTEQIRIRLSTCLQRSTAQRYLESAKSSIDTDANAPVVSESDNATHVYYIGPYSKATITQHDLFNLVLRLHFPHDSINDAHFCASNEVLIRNSKNKLESTGLSRKF